jgi:hypothetical protein
MSATAPPAFPFVEVRIDTTGLRPVAQRAPGVIAVVGAATAGDANTPVLVSTGDDAEAFGPGSPLAASLALALVQDPKPSTIYGVRAATDGGGDTDYAGALASLEGADDVTFVSLAAEPDPGDAGSKLRALLAHVEQASADGNKRIAFAEVDPATPKSSTYVADVAAAYEPIKSSVSRMVLVAARGAQDAVTGEDADVATAVMAAIAGYPPQASAVLKPVFGLRIATAQKYTPSEIIGLSNANIIPVIDPALIPGDGLFLAEGRTFTSDADLLDLDTVRVLDAAHFALKAGLIGTIGDARITKAGLMSVQLRTEAILGTMAQADMIAGFTVRIPVLDILSLPESAWSPAEADSVRTARQTRSVEMDVALVLSGVVHHLLVTVNPVFA